MRKFYIYGEPQGKARPRFARTRNSVRTYTPNKTVDYEEKVRLAYLTQCKEETIEGPVKVYIQANFLIPKSWSKRKKVYAYSGLIKPTKKPDVDNIAKAVCDALNGIAYKDDSQIVKLTVEKYYAPVDAEGFVIVTIEEV